MRTPKYLYHASSRNDLKVIEPRATTVPKGFDHGPVVFVTDCFRFSTQFIVPTDDSWANGGAFGDTCFFVISDRKRFEKADKGGSIYLVSSEGFKKYNRKEWFKNGSVKPADKVTFSSGLSAMVTHNVQVYFVDKKTYAKYMEAPERSFSMLNKLTSENEKWGRKVVRMDIYRGSKKRTN